MYRLGIIEESLENQAVLELLAKYFVSQRIEHVPEDECPIWHTNEYCVPEELLKDILDVLKDSIKKTWYIHAFNDRNLFVVLRGKWFEIPQVRDQLWNEMIEYGVNVAGVERCYLETIPLHV